MERVNLPELLRNTLSGCTMLAVAHAAVSLMQSSKLWNADETNFAREIEDCRRKLLTVIALCPEYMQLTAHEQVCIAAIACRIMMDEAQ